VVSVVYFDTSALLKRYVTEVGSAWVQNLLTSSTDLEVFTSSLTTIEAICAFARRLREGVLTQATYATVERAFDYDVRYKYGLIEVTSVTLATTRDLAKRYPLRAYDAVQLASAWLANQCLVRAGKAPLTFICADEQLLSIAETAGLLSDNPHRYG